MSTNIGKFALKDKNKIKGNAWVGLLVLLVLMITLGLALISDVLGTITQSKRSEQVLVAQALSEAGIEKAYWKLNESGGSYIGENDLTLDTGVVDISVTNIDSENKYIDAMAYVPSKTNPITTRKVRAKVTADFNESSVHFHYGVQVGHLGVTMSNNSAVIGNLYADGNVECGNGSQITGDAFVSGHEHDHEHEHDINHCNIGNDAKAHSVISSSVTRDLYYANSKSGSTAKKFINIHHDELPHEIGMPISHSTITTWESWAEAGGVHEGDLSISGGSQTLGPIRINGDLTVTNGATLTITGVVWVSGDIHFSNNAIIKLATSYGQNSGMMIADSPHDEEGHGHITVSNNVTIQGSGNPKSTIMMLSTNGGSSIDHPAITAGNNSTAVIYYASEGMVEISNNAKLRAVSGEGLHLSNGAQVQYDTGLADANFSGGPGGSWQIKEWQIVY
jgi:hypothetical protein